MANFRRNALALLTSFICVGTLIAGLVLAIIAERKAVTMKNTRKTYATVATGEFTESPFPRLHKSCNASDVDFLTRAFADSLEVTGHARDKLLNESSSNEIYKRWFGDGSVYEVLGVLDGIANMTKTDILLRCDDVDGRCAANPGYYAGHHRLEHDAETVICDYFYESRAFLKDLCANGTLKEFGPAKYAGIDMIHRYFHVSFVSMDEYVGEFTEEIEDMLELAKSNSTFAVRNVDNYLYYLADVYSSDKVKGGCLGL